MRFLGYRRPDGKIGVRNHIAIIPSVFCASLVASRIAQSIAGTVALPHPHGCTQLRADAELTRDTLAGMGSNPNIAAALVVGLGCEQVRPEEIAERIAKTGKPLETLIIQNVGGTLKTIEQGMRIASEMATIAAQLSREECLVSDLVLATECGGSDSTSGIAANPALGIVSEMVVASGGTVILSETTELMGAEHLLAKRAVNAKVGEKVYKIVAEVEESAKSAGVDMRGSQPTPGNIASGISSIEEKSLGCIYKAGTAPIQDVIGYAEKPSGKGLFIMDTPGQDGESVTGMVAGGAQVVIFTTGLGTPLGSPVAPVIKITGNPNTVLRMGDHIDFSVASIVLGEGNVEDSAKELFKLLLKVMSGQLTRSEILGHQEFAIHRLAPTI